MTDTTPTPEPDGRALELPERPRLDPLSAVTLAISDELGAQIDRSGQPVTIAIDVRAIAEAAIGALGGEVPSVPRWDDEARTIGGRTLGADAAPEPTITLDVAGPGVLAFAVDPGTVDPGDIALAGTAVVPTVDALPWLLAGIAAARAADSLTDATCGTPAQE